MIAGSSTLSESTDQPTIPRHLAELQITTEPDWPSQSDLDRFLSKVTAASRLGLFTEGEDRQLRTAMTPSSESGAYAG